MSDPSVDAITGLVTEYFRVCAILGDTTTTGKERALSEAQEVAYIRRAEDARVALLRMSGSISARSDKVALRRIADIGSEMMRSTGTGKAYRDLAAEYFVVAGGLLDGLEPLSINR